MQGNFLRSICVINIAIAGLNFAYTAKVMAYEVETHAALTRAARRISVVSQEKDILQQHGVRHSTNEYPNTDNRPGEVAELLTFGAIQEDGKEYWKIPSPRPIQHFYDPVNDRPLTFFLEEALLADPLIEVARRPIKSPDWALEDGDDIGLPLPQNFSYRDARQYEYLALTAGSQWERRRNTGLMFQSLGQVIHHIQDMAQPEHVRNDVHLTLQKDTYEEMQTKRYILSDPSHYEAYTKHIEAGLGQILSEHPYPALMLTEPRIYWHHDLKRWGMADFANREFLSHNTNFHSKNGVAETGEYDKPAHDGGTSKGLLSELLPMTGESLCDQLRNDSLVINVNQIDCRVTFYRTHGIDRVTQQPIVMERASSYSVFNQYLNRYKRSILWYPSADGGTPLYYIDGIFTLNRFNFDEMHKYLLPRAVGYSAGLLNFFFRGKIEVLPPENGLIAAVDHAVVNQVNQGFDRIKVRLRNATPDITLPDGIRVPQSMRDGQLTAVVRYRRNLCYTDSLSGEPAPDSVVPSGCQFFTIQAGGSEEVAVSEPMNFTGSSVPTTLTPYEFTFTGQNLIPINAMEVHLHIVYRGQMGDEEDSLTVAALDISEPTFVVFMNGSDHFFINGQYHTPAEIRSDPDLLDAVDSDDPDREPDFNIDPEPLQNVRIKIGNEYLNDPAQIPPFRYARIAVIGLQQGELPMQFEAGITASLYDTVFNVGLAYKQTDPETRIFAYVPTVQSRGIYRLNMLYLHKGVGAHPVPGTFESLPPLVGLGPVPINLLQ